MDEQPADSRAVAADIASAFYDWLDFERTPRKVIARRQERRALPALEQGAMRAAKELLDEGRISIIVKFQPARAGRKPTVTYVAERVTW